MSFSGFLKETPVCKKKNAPQKISKIPGQGPEVSAKPVSHLCFFFFFFSLNSKVRMLCRDSRFLPARKYVHMFLEHTITQKKKKNSGTTSRLADSLGVFCPTVQVRVESFGHVSTFRPFFFCCIFVVFLERSLHEAIHCYKIQKFSLFFFSSSFFFENPMQEKRACYLLIVVEKPINFFFFCTQLLCLLPFAAPHRGNPPLSCG